MEDMKSTERCFCGRPIHDHDYQKCLSMIMTIKDSVTQSDNPLEALKRAQERAAKGDDF